MISIGAVIGGPECAFFDSHMTKLMNYCADNRSQSSQTATVNVVFHLPGSICKPDYVGLRTATFSKKRKISMIQIGVEEEWIASRDDQTVLAYIYETTDEALGLALDEFEKHGIEYDLEADRRFLEAWKESEGFWSYLDTFKDKR